VQSKERKRRPAPPFITSTLQQEAARKLGFGTSRTMRIAQKLYEGVALGDEGTVGLILHAYRLGDPPVGKTRWTELRQLIARDFGSTPAAEPNVLQDQGQERAGSARGDPPDLGAAHPQVDRAVPRSGRTAASCTS
jgi:DNA topoisomerase-1